MNKKSMLVMSLLLILIITACASSEETAGGSSETNDPPAQAADSVAAVIRLAEDFDDALTVQAQLAVGTLQLDETELALDETSAAELLPLWQALQSLNNSDTAAAAEINAVENQIQETMSVEQISAIKELALTAESVTMMIEDGTLSLRGGGRFGGGERDGEDAFPGGFPGGGLPGGGLPGGGPGGGGIGGRGFGGRGDLSEDDIATRQAQFAEGDGFAALQDQAMLRAVIRLLEEKTGVAQEAPVNIFTVVFQIISEATGLSVADVRAQTAENVTLAEIVETNGGDVEAVHGALVEALSELPDVEGQDVAQIAADWLGLDSSE